MSRRLKLSILAGALAGLALSASAFAQEPPAVKTASGPEKARLQGLIKDAEKEGSINYWDAVIQPETNDDLSAAFRKHYGLPASFKVNYTLSNTSGLVTRVDQELQANKVTIDVAAIASLPWVFEHIRHGDVMEYDSPEYGAFSKIFSLGMGKKGYFAFNGAYVFVPMWSTDGLKFAGTSWKDVIGAVPSGRLSVGDVSKSEAYAATQIGLRKVLGPDYFQAVAKMQPTYLIRSEQIASRLVSGEDLMAFSGMPTRAYQFNQRGGQLKFLLPKEGVVLLPQAMFILKPAPHPAAAKLWIDFVLSAEGQAILVKREALISGRDGFKSPMPDYAPAIADLNVIPIDWPSISVDDMKKIREEWSGIFGR
jgi:iron(III) transport system substrate-binding protein